MMNSLVPHENVNLNCDEKNIEFIILNFVAESLNYNRATLTIRKLTDGFSNIVYALHSSEDDDVIVKIHGKNSDLLADHRAELPFMLYFAQFRVCSPVLLTFENGFIYRYLPGTPVRDGDEEKGLLIARKLAQFHSIPLINGKSHCQLAEKLRHFVNLLSGVNDELCKRVDSSVVSSLFGDIFWEQITKDIDRIERTLNKKKSKWRHLSVVICHNDTQNYNFLYDQNCPTEVALIDFEYCSRNIWLYDVVNYFLTYAGCPNEEPDYDRLYLARDKQKKWLKTYLANALFLKDKIEEQMTLDEICDLGDCLRAPIHLYWALWALLESLVNPDIMAVFDCVKYGKHRLKQYERYRNDFFLSAKKYQIFL